MLDPQIQNTEVLTFGHLSKELNFKIKYITLCSLCVGEGVDEEECGELDREWGKIC